MNWKTTRALSAALLLGTSALAAANFVSLHQAFAAPLIVENKALVDAVKGAQDANKAGRYPEALAKAKEADAIQGKPAELTRQIHQMIVAYAISAKDYPSAFAQLDKMIAANEGDKAKNLSDAMGLALQTNNQPKVESYKTALGNNLTPQVRLVIASGYAKAKKYKDAVEEVQPLMPNGQPADSLPPQTKESLLRFLHSVYNEMNDTANRRNILEELVLFYGKPQDWHDLFQLARNEKGLSDEQQLDIVRLRLAVGDLKAAGDFIEGAQSALVADYPNDAKTILDKGNQAKVLNAATDERVGRLVKMTNDRVAADGAKQAELQQKSASDANASVKLGLMYWTYAKHKEAETAVRAGMKGKLADPEGAKVALGHTLLSQGNKPEAVNAFNSVARTSKWASVARLWSIYARRA
jgi:hypothetical protein